MKRRLIIGKINKAIALIFSFSMVLGQFSVGMSINAAETDQAQTEKMNDTDETEKSEKIKAEPCLSIENSVIPASAAGSRVYITISINDENIGSTKYYQHPDVYIDIDRRLKYISFKNGTQDGTKGIGLTGEMYINTTYKHTLRLHSESGLGANGVFAVIEVEVPNDAQPGEIYYLNICDAGSNITKVSIPETDDVLGEIDKPLKTTDTSNDKYLMNTSFDGYILIDPDSVSLHPQTKKNYEIVFEDNIEYYVYDDHAEVVYCLDEEDKVVIKSEVKGQKVTGVADYALVGVNITSIELPNTITYIGDYAFAESKLVSIDFPDSILTIGEGAFEYSNIKSIGLNEGIESIGKKAFRFCYSLSELKLPASLKEISDEMCMSCTKLAEVEIPSGITSIGYAAFEGTAITTARIPESVKEIDGFAFCGCQALEHVFLSSGLERLSGHVFWGCQQLKILKLPDTLISIDNYAFAKTRITKLDIPASVKEIGVNTFMDSSIETINYSDDLETLPDFAFSGANKMKTVKLPSKLISIPDSCFFRCSFLSSVDIPETVTNIDRYAFCDCGLNELKIPGNVKSIGERAFSCLKISNIVIPETITELPIGLFESSEIKTVKLPPGLKVIPEDTFCSCKSLTDVDIPESVTEIQNSAFEESSLTTLYIPESVTTIASDAFRGSNLKTIYGVKGSYAEKFAKDQGLEFVEKTSEVKSGDTNCDGQVDMADAVLIMQALANPNRYGLDGSAEYHITEQGILNGDMDGDGLTVGDAQAIQRKLLGLDDSSIMLEV